MMRNIHGGWRWHFDEPYLLGLTGANYIELSANRWNMGADVYLDHSADMLLVRYEDFFAAGPIAVPTVDQLLALLNKVMEAG